MKLEITKKFLVNALLKMNDVATKGIQSEFEKAGRVTIDVQDKKVVFLSTNGHIYGKLEITDQSDSALKVHKTGQATVSAPIVLATCRALGGKNDDHVFELSVDGNLRIKDLDKEKANKKRQSVVELETLKEDHKFQIPSPKSGFSYNFPTSVLKEAINAVGKYRPNAAYRVEYELVCMHFMKDEIRFVCGNGPRFAVHCVPLDGKNGASHGMPPISDIDNDGKKHILPVDQAVIMLRMLEDGEHATLTYRDDTHLHVDGHNGVVLDIKGIPHVQYVAYENHAFRADQSKAIADIKVQDLEEASAVIWSVRDKELEDEANYHTYQMVLDGQEASLCVTDKKYTATWTGNCDFYKITASSFKSEYAARVLLELVGAASGYEYVRFYCIDETSIMIAEPVNLNESQKDEHGAPVVMRQPNDPRFFLFYASVRETDSE